ncbi:HAMP domain-containing sensor histidine kinase [Neomegalonema sp.]|uniref:sensor histidine kinase n=1 Tax=Neomegalonema sp. TaxID=2039713 RepID=UPI002603A85B|nr:HAMP domain-containing sensor histidine kinase [Neomegalonema sp.]MDD2869517.1 HAMP domain-containing sensor histidine kinase [Neomegalonema sp.]
MAPLRRIRDSLAARIGIAAGASVLALRIAVLPFHLLEIREDHLRDRVDAAWLVTLAEDPRMDAARDGDAPAPVASGSGWRAVTLLNAASSDLIVLERAGAREQVFWRAEMKEAGFWVQLETEPLGKRLLRAFGTLIGDAPPRFFVQAQPRPPDSLPTGTVIESAPLKRRLREAALGDLLEALGLALLTGLAAGFAARRLAGEPARRLATGVAAFRADPEHAEPFPDEPLAPGAEMAEVERGFSALQSELRMALKQKSRLADLGEAMAKISHDLRNTLTSAQLLADRLERSQDPVVRQIAPKILRSLDRAADLSAQTLRYGKADEPPPERKRVPLEPFLQEVAAIAAPQDDHKPRYEIDAPPEAVAEADPDQLYRILLNLIRNAAQAIEGSGVGGLILISARRADGGVAIDVKDDGPGLLAEAKATLFKPFKSGGRKGGTGLGLSIAQDLARAHGGEVRLMESSEGAHFRVRIPDKKNGPSLA